MTETKRKEFKLSAQKTERKLTTINVDSELKEFIDSFISSIPMKPKNYSEIVNIAFKRLAKDYQRDGIVVLQAPEDEVEPLNAAS